MLPAPFLRFRRKLFMSQLCNLWQCLISKNVFGVFIVEKNCCNFMKTLLNCVGKLPAPFFVNLEKLFMGQLCNLLQCLICEKTYLVPFWLKKLLKFHKGVTLLCGNTSGTFFENLEKIVYRPSF